MITHVRLYTEFQQLTETQQHASL